MNGITEARLALLDKAREQQNYWPRTDSAAIAPKTTPAGMSRWALYCHRVTSRRALAALTDAELRDIGLDFQQARIEAMKPFWRE